MILTKREVNEGELVIVTSGSYSDYGIYALCVAAASFNTQEFYYEFRATKPAEYSYRETDFGDWLIKTGKLVKVPFNELLLPVDLEASLELDGGSREGMLIRREELKEAVSMVLGKLTKSCPAEKPSSPS